MVTKQSKDETQAGDTPEVSPDSQTPTGGEELSQSTDVTAPVDTTTEEAAPKKRLTPVERLQKQLDEARAAAQKKAGDKLGKAQEELTKAVADLERAKVREAKARAEVNLLSEQAGGIDPIVAADTERRIAEAEAEAAEQDDQS